MEDYAKENVSFQTKFFLFTYASDAHFRKMDVRTETPTSCPKHVSLSQKLGLTSQRKIDMDIFQSFCIHTENVNSPIDVVLFS